jgi:hypothetical protein
VVSLFPIREVTNAVRLVAAVLTAALLWPAEAFADLTAPPIPRAPVAIPAALTRVSVRDASVLSAVYPIPPTVARLLPQWRAALRGALLRSALFRGGSEPALTLTARILEFARSGDTLMVFVRYQLDRPGSPTPIFTADILSDSGVTSVDDNPIVDRPGVTRNPRQVDAAVRADIVRFVGRLQGFVRVGGHLFAGQG